MQKNKDKVEIKPLQPVKSKLNWLAFMLLGAVIFCGALLSTRNGSGFALAVSMCVGLVGCAIVVTRKVDPETRRRSMLYLLPMVFGFALSVYPFQSPIPAIIGVGTMIALVMWFGVLRHPIEFRQAMKQFRAGEKLRALQLTTLAIKKRPTHWESYQLRSTINTALFRSIEAERDAHAAIRLKPDNYTCYNALGRALLAQERYLEADDAFSKAIELAPHYTLNHYNKGLTHYRLEQFDEAIKHFEFAVRGRMPFEEWQLLANYYLGCSLSQVGETKKAQQAFRALKRFRHSYNELVSLHQDMPDYPAVLQSRKELEDMRSHLV